MDRFTIEKNNEVELIKATFSDESIAYEVYVLDMVVFYPDNYEEAYKLFETLRKIEKATN